MKKKLDDFFGLTKLGTSVATEIIAGVVTFLAMAYILIVNPNSIIGNLNEANAVNWASVFIATALGAIVGTLLMALLAKMPLAQAPGLGLNSMVGGLLGGWGAFQCSLGNAMFLVFVSGVLFLLLSVVTVKGVSIREMIFDGIPASMRTAISVGIGLFIAFIGMENSGLITDSPYTLVTLVDFTKGIKDPAVAPVMVCLIGLIVIFILDHCKVKGAVIIGIVVATILGIPLGVTTWNPGNLDWNFVSAFKNFFSFDTNNGGTFAACFNGGLAFPEGTSVISIIMMIITFAMIDMFDTMGTVVGCCSSAGLCDENEKPFNYNKIMISDSVATVAGSVFGTSTVTTFVESGAGVAAGGRTGLTALTTAICFFLAIFLMPVISSIPSAAAASALLYVGALMVKGAKNIKTETAKDTVATFMTIAMMPLAYSITTGIGFGLLSYVLVDVIGYLVDLIKYACNKETNEKPAWDLSVVTIIIAVLFVVYFFVPTSF